MVKKTLNAINKRSLNVVSSVYIYENKERLRGYTFFSDNKIYCLVFNYLKNLRIDTTTLNDLTDIEKLKEYDNRVYGGFF